MQAGSKRGNKKTTKLSLTKKSGKVNQAAVGSESSGKSTAGIGKILAGNVDLNETCEFQQPAKFFRHGEVIGASASDINDLCEEELSVCCQVCKKELSHMSLRCREQHVNRCIDKVEVAEKVKKEEAKLLESARTAVLDCPMCGKHFKSDSARTSHLKKCSVSVGVSTEKMLQLVKDQEKERQEEVAAGIVPKQLRSKITKTSVPKKRKLKEPKSQFEEDVQVAMAMSSSLAVEETDELSAGDSGREGRRKRNKKNKPDDVCLLTTLTDEDRRKRMEEKINNILQMANNTTSIKCSLPHDSCLKSGSQENGHSLWNIGSRDPVSCNNEQFYVGALVPPLSVNCSKPGARLHRLSSIPGREKSFIRKDDNVPEQSAANNSNMFGDDIITASTQTAVVLAELAVDDTDTHDCTVSSQLTPDPSYTNNIVDLQASGFCVERLILNDADKSSLVSETLKDYKRMINNQEYSDVTIVTCGQTFYTHQLILAFRCPKLLQMMSDGKIHLQSAPDVVLSLLNYIYTGEVNLTPGTQSDLVHLANQLKLPTLISACNKAVLEAETSEIFVAKETSDTEVVESQLDMKEIWGESDSDPDDDDGEGGTEDRIDNEINDDDYREISYTQKKRLREGHSKQQDNTDNYMELSESSKSEYEILNCPDKPNELSPASQSDIKTDNDSSNSDELCPSREEVISSMPDLNVLSSRKTCDKEEHSEEEPTPKRIRLSSDRGSKEDMHTECNPTAVCIDVSEPDGLGNNPSKVVCENMNEEETIENLSSGINSSSVDLFGSPTPKKQALTLSECKDTGDEIDIDLPVLQRNSKCLATDDGASVPKLNLDTSNENTEINKIELDHTIQKVIDIDTEIEDFSQDDMPGDNHEPGDDDLKDKTSVIKSTLIIDSSDDDDLQLTGDNFDELIQYSPTFSVRKSSTGRDSNCSTPQSVSSTKYLGLKSATDGHSSLSERKELKQTKINNTNNEKNDNSENICSENYTDNNGKTENVKDSVVVKTWKFKHVTNSMKNKVKIDSTSDRVEEIITLTTEASNKTEDKSTDSDTDPQQVDDKVVQVGKLGEDQIENGSGNKRKSTSYGQHEISVYSGDGDNSTCPDNQSFNGNNTDIWDGYDDCGIMHPCDSPGGVGSPLSSPGLSQGQTSQGLSHDQTSPGLSHGQTSPGLSHGQTSPGLSQGQSSPVVGYQHIDEDLQQTSPIIPQQSELIDLTQNDDSNTGDVIENIVFEDGDDSFVFKVDDQPDTTDKSPAKTTIAEFKTPTVTDNQAKKKVSTWEPPSPFTPMPQYNSMNTPALKKAVQKYGVKPVAKKRMIKVLEDIYHQTHQYETDSEIEEEEGDVEQTTVTSATTSDNLVSSSQGDISSQDSDVSELLEESCLHTGLSSDSDTPASPQKGVDVTKKLFEYMMSHSDVHSKILMYEPLELDVLKRDIKEAGIRCSMEKLMDFLDERCIAFTNKNTRKRQPARRGRKKKATSKATE